LPDEALSLIHSGAGPICQRDRETYYGHIAQGIAKLERVTNRRVMDLVQEAQRKLA
jgi:hypothetical protein